MVNLVVIIIFCAAQLTEEEKAKIAEEALKKAERANRAGGGLNPFAVLILLLAISVGKSHSAQGSMDKICKADKL